MSYKKEITITYPSQAAAAKAHGISPAILSTRLKQGLTIEQALGLEPYTSPHHRAITVNGTVYNTLADAAKAYNIKTQTVYQRITRYGWSVEAALTIPTMKKAVKSRLDKI